MPSKLVGDARQLKWGDFKKKAGAAPGPGQSATGAETRAPVSYSGPTPKRVEKSDPPQFEMTDNFVATASLSVQSWVMSWVSTQPPPFPDDLLNHEQGHYDVSGLSVRDLFVDVIALKGTTYASAKELNDAVKALADATIGKAQAINDLYDAEVHPEQNKGLSRGPKQKEWDALFAAARTQARPGGALGPDGSPLKARLVDVVVASGRSP
jgi:hypothetical protein